MSALEAYFGIEEFTFDDPSLHAVRLDGHFGIEEFVFDNPSLHGGRLDGYFGIEEYPSTPYLPVSTRHGYAYAYEFSLLAPPVAARDGFAYAYEFSLLAPPVPVRNGYAYAYENSITQQNPIKRWVHNGVTWERNAEFMWNGTTWQQVL